MPTAKASDDSSAASTPSKSPPPKRSKGGGAAVDPRRALGLGGNVRRFPRSSNGGGTRPPPPRAAVSSAVARGPIPPSLAPPPPPGVSAAQFRAAQHQMQMQQQQQLQLQQWHQMQQFQMQQQQMQMGAMPLRNGATSASARKEHPRTRPVTAPRGSSTGPRGSAPPPPAAAATAAVPPRSNATNDAVGGRALRPFECSWARIGACKHAQEIHLCSLETCPSCKVEKVHHPCQSVWESSTGQTNEVLRKRCPGCHPTARRLLSAVQENGGRPANISPHASASAQRSAARPAPPGGRPATGERQSQKRKERARASDDSSSGGGAGSNDANKTNDNDHTAVDDEAAALHDAGLSAKQAYEKVATTPGRHELGVLLAMRTGMVGDDFRRLDQRFEEYKTKKWIAKTAVRVTTAFLNAEIKRRYQALKALDEDFSNKMVSLSKGTNDWRTKQLSDGDDAYLPFRSDARWLLAKANEILDSIKSEHQQQEETRRQSGQHVKKLTLLKIRLIHAWLLDAHREQLAKQFDLLGRIKLDARNSAHRELTIFESTVGYHNHAEWVPTSLAFPDLHPDFNGPMDLALPSDAKTLSADDGAKILLDLLSLLKKADANWKASGNGKDNKVEDGVQIRVRLLGTEYSSGAIPEVSEDDDEEGVEIKHVSDDRWQFCFNNVALAYLWGMLEEMRLTTFAVQNCERVGLVGGKTASARETNGLAPRGQRGGRQRSEQSFERAMEKLPAMFESCMSNLFAEKDSKDRLIQLEDQLRKQSALHSTCENDLNEAKLALLTYEHTTPRNDTVAEILDLHRTIVAQKQRALDESAAKKDEWVEEIERLKEELESAAAAAATAAAAASATANTDSTSELASIGGGGAAEEEDNELCMMEEGEAKDDGMGLDDMESLFEEASGMDGNQLGGEQDDDESLDEEALLLDRTLNDEQIRGVTNELYQEVDYDGPVPDGQGGVGQAC